jgi:hypothetical protein
MTKINTNMKEAQIEKCYADRARDREFALHQKALTEANWERQCRVRKQREQIESDTNLVTTDMCDYRYLGYCVGLCSYVDVYGRLGRDQGKLIKRTCACRAHRNKIPASAMND